MGKQMLLGVLFFISIRQLSGQTNLVQNPDFEIYDTCPYQGGQLHFAKYWFQPNTVNGNIYNSSSSEYYNQCAAFSWGVPLNNLGYQIANSGVAYSGIYCYTALGDVREYIQTKLLTPLTSGKRYCIEFYVSLANSVDYACDLIGAYLSNDSVLYSSTTWAPLPFNPQVSNSSGNVISDTINWVLISGQIVASGGEQFITMGNFNDNASTTAVSVNSLGIYNGAYYYIDDVSVYCCDTTGCEIPEIPEFFIPTAFSPNGDNNNDFLHVRGPVQSMDFYIYDRWGELVYHGTDPTKGWDGTFKNEALNSAVFTYYFRGTMLDGKEVTEKGNITLVR